MHIFSINISFHLPLLYYATGINTLIADSFQKYLKAFFIGNNSNFLFPILYLCEIYHKVTAFKLNVRNF